MMEMVLSKIKIDENSEGQLIVLKEKNGSRQLPIVIGISEAVAIKKNINGVRSLRPMTHDLLANVISGLGARLEKVSIYKIEAGTFYAKLVLRLIKGQSRNRKISIDARPSDSIALAVRMDASISVEEKIFEALKYQGQLF